MNKKLSRLISCITLAAFSMSASFESLKSYAYTANEEKISYRTSYTIYGDLNGDGSTDSFDVVIMRKMAVKNEFSEIADLNNDNKVDTEDLILLNDYVLGKNVFFDAYLYDDADKDNVCDLLEVAMLNTNPDSADTDGDTLSDFDEIVYTRTSPTNKYTNGLSITDAYDDNDGDKLTNKEELSYGTNPHSSDSDSDGLSDYDEINKYKSDPNSEDTDGDGIIDGDEVELGLNPTSDKSDSSTHDSQRTFEKKIDASNNIFSCVNTDDMPYEVSIDIKAAGIAEKELKASFGEYSNVSEDEKIKIPTCRRVIDMV